MDSTITYGRLDVPEGQRYMAGISIDAIVEVANVMYSGKAKVTPVVRDDLPKEYTCSIMAVENSASWRKYGTYLLIKNYEEYESFHEQFPYG